MNRDELRAATVGSKIEFKTELVTIKEDVEVEIRQITLKERRFLIEKCGDVVDEEKGEIQIRIMDWMAWVTIYACYVPGTEERLFDDADYESFENQRSGSWADILMGKAQALNTTDLEALVKNLEVIPSDSSSSDSPKSSGKLPDGSSKT